jgi:DNA-binding response OmpR family regulator
MSTSMVNSAMMPPMALVVAAHATEYEQIAHSLSSVYRMVKATTLGEATVRLRQEKPAVIVLDPYDLPDGDGLEWLRYLRNNPATQDLVVACVTTHSSVRDKVSGFLAGADDYIVPPINSETFAYRLRLLVRIGRHAAWKQ